MEKKLQDYLHYYLGCDYWTNNSQGNLNAKTLHDVIDMCNRNKEVELHLRRLEDISDDEWFKIECETSVAPDAIGWHGVRESILTMDTRHRFHWTITNEVLIILRKLSVDVDGLIDAGLAVDAKTVANG